MSPSEPVAATSAAVVRFSDKSGDEGPLARFAALERRYDGLIPPHLRERALAEDWCVVEERRAGAQVRFFEDMARFQVAAIRSRRQVGSAHAPLRRDLQLYLERRRYWRRIRERARDAELRQATRRDEP